MRALLDVNVLIALLDAGHVHHAMALTWLEREVDQGWASCPLTQNGCIRIMSQPNYPAPLPASEVAARLAEAAATPHHEFWPADVSLLDSTWIDWSKVLGHRQVTDVYLLALAVRHNGRFVTFNRNIRTDTVTGAGAAHLHVFGQA